LRQAADRIGFDVKTGLHATTSIDKKCGKGNYAELFGYVDKANS